MLTGRPISSQQLRVAGFALLLLACAPDDGAPPRVDPDATTGDVDPERLEGLAELHLHMFAEEAFGGGWFHGSHAGSPEHALGPCDGGEPGDHARLQDELAPLLDRCDDVDLDALAERVPLVDVIVRGGGRTIGQLIGSVPGSTGDTGLHPDRTSGFPDFDGWPRWDAIAHQQVWEGHLEEAHRAGLRLAVISAVSFDWLCEALPDENKIRPQCNEMDDVRVQLEAAHRFAAAHAFAEIALSAADARRIVAEGKLALVLSVEASHLMHGAADWRPMFEELYDLGVRTLQPIHQLDNRFGGAAPHNAIFQVALYAENCHIDEDCGLTTPELTLGFDVDAECKNVLGLTAEGRALVQEMMARGMLVDIAHFSERSVRDIHEIAVENAYYPLYVSHGHFREIMLPAKAAEEKTSPAWVVAMIRETGGMFGLRTASDEVNAYDPSPVANTCHGSSRSFAQAYDYGRMGLGVAMGLGSDLNGFITQTRPRFGPDACSASFSQERDCQARDELAMGAPPLLTAFDSTGLGHIGLLMDLVDDLDQLGTDTTALRDSADAFVRMWERASSDRDGPADDPSDLRTDGITIAPAHAIRREQGC
jgi:microsomal dipeptidase-like Zn-dependent dipeptidase